MNKPTSTAPELAKSMSWKKKVVLGFLALFALIFLFLVEEHFRGTWGVARWKTRMAAKGEPLTIAAATPVPPSANGNGMPAVVAAAARLSQFPPKLHPPPAMMYASSGKVVVITRVGAWPTSGRPRTNVTWAPISDAVREREGALADVVNALNERHFSAPLDFYAGWSLRLPHLSSAHHMVRWLSAAALESFRRGDTERGLDYAEAAIHVVATLENEPLAISQRTRMACAEWAFGITWEGTHAEGLYEQGLKRLQDAWDKQDFLKPMKRALSMEHVMVSHEFERFRDADTGLDQWPAFSGAAIPPVVINSPSTFLEAMIDHMPELFRNGVYTPIWKFAWSCQDELGCLERIEGAVTAWNTAIVQQSARAVAVLGNPEEGHLIDWDESHLKDRNFYDRMRYVVSPRFGNLMEPMQRAFCTQTLRELARTALALQRYKLRVGRAAALDDLVPEFLENLPRDFMNGGVLQYRNGALYSVGLDGEDDRGELGTNAVRGFSILRGKDFVWPQEASPEEVKARFGIRD